VVNTLPSLQNLATDTWVRATWEEFLDICDRLCERTDAERSCFSQWMLSLTPQANVNLLKIR
jgi:hypothetical protein